MEETINNSFFANDKIDSDFAKWMEALNKKGGYGGNDTFVWQAGKKYAKVIQCLNNHQRCVFAFVDTDGNIYKPDGWKKPSKYIRGHVSNDKLPLLSGELYATNR